MVNYFSNGMDAGRYARSRPNIHALDRNPGCATMNGAGMSDSRLLALTEALSAQPVTWADDSTARRPVARNATVVRERSALAPCPPITPRCAKTATCVTTSEPGKLGALYIRQAHKGAAVRVMREEPHPESMRPTYQRMLSATSAIETPRLGAALDSITRA